jgi:hypothetical protein
MLLLSSPLCCPPPLQCFETESELRLQGKPKTPDVLLMVPLAVRLPCSPRSAARHQTAASLASSSSSSLATRAAGASGGTGGGVSTTVTVTVSSGTSAGGASGGAGSAVSEKDRESSVAMGDVSVVHWIDSKGGQTKDLSPSTLSLYTEAQHSNVSMCIRGE